ncbi:hypothetical protein F5884DRAFT_850558 [Xylogone sp. PMI_703]|nr:hypothetical protein F5884DRAFT_850558 [Xylogone sp. PMI_703]
MAWSRRRTICFLLFPLCFLSIHAAATYEIDVTSCGTQMDTVKGAMDEALQLFQDLNNYYVNRAIRFGGKPTNDVDVTFDALAMQLFNTSDNLNKAVGSIKTLARSNAQFTLYCDDATAYRSYPNPALGDPADAQPGWLFLPKQILTSKGPVCADPTANTQAYSIPSQKGLVIVICTVRGMTNAPSVQLKDDYDKGISIRQLETTSFTFMHELGHILGNFNDEKIPSTGKRAYGFSKCISLAHEQASLTVTNCDSLAFLAAGLMVTQQRGLDWSTGRSRESPFFLQ